MAKFEQQTQQFDTLQSFCPCHTHKLQVAANQKDVAVAAATASAFAVSMDKPHAKWICQAIFIIEFSHNSLVRVVVAVGRIGDVVWEQHNKQ